MDRMDSMSNVKTGKFVYELPSPTTSEMVSTIPKQYSKARSQCHYSVGKNPSAYLQMLLDALVAPGTNTLYILRATGS